MLPMCWRVTRIEMRKISNKYCEMLVVVVAAAASVLAYRNWTIFVFYRSSLNPITITHLKGIKIRFDWIEVCLKFTSMVKESKSNNFVDLFNNSSLNVSMNKNKKKRNRKSLSEFIQIFCLLYTFGWEWSVWIYHK